MGRLSRIVILLLDPEAVPGTLFHPGGIGDVNLYRKSIDKSLMLYGKWLSNTTFVNDRADVMSASSSTIMKIMSVLSLTCIPIL